MKIRQFTSFIAAISLFLLIVLLLTPIKTQHLFIEVVFGASS